MNDSQFCPLCHSSKTALYFDKKHLFYQCSNCFGLFRAAETYISAASEKARYEEHNNDVSDVRYQNFVSPIVTMILQDFDATHFGLDYGSGTGPVISKILLDNDYSIQQYDPFFANFPELLRKQYDYIVCCEVMEHFHHPYKEFELLKKRLFPEGKLYCMTAVFDDTIDFKTWHYKNDPTHVFFYHKKTLEWIQKAFGFKTLEVQGRLIVFAT